METIYEQTEYDRITPPIRKRYERISRERGVTVIPLASGERAPVEDEPEQEEAEPKRGWFGRGDDDGVF